MTLISHRIKHSRTLRKNLWSRISSFRFHQKLSNYVGEEATEIFIIIMIHGICHAPLPKDTKRSRRYNNKLNKNILRIKVSFKMRFEYGDRRSTADVNGDGVPFQGSSHWKGSVTGTCVASRNLEVETMVSACLNNYPKCPLDELWPQTPKHPYCPHLVIIVSKYH